MRGVLLLLAVIAFSARARADETEEPLAFPSATYSSMRQVLNRSAPEAQLTVTGKLAFPRERSGPTPAVVVVHSLAGFREQNEGWQAAQLRDAGFATLTYDSFAARNLGDLANNIGRGPPPYPSAFADAFAALSALSRDPRIDPQRIGILGFSFGGEVAHDMAFERLRAALGSGTQRFAAHVAYYPAGNWGVAAVDGAYTGEPVLMMIGDDDTLPVAKARAYLAYHQAANHPVPIELRVFEGAKHGWTDPSLQPPRNYPYLASTKGCPYVLITRDRGLRFLADGQEQPFEDGAFGTCIRDHLGYVMGYDETTRSKSTATAIAFLRRYLAPAP